MAKRSSENERIKRSYLQFLQSARGRDISSVDAVAQAIDRFQDYCGHRSFRKFNSEQAMGFKDHLIDQRNDKTGKPLAAATICSMLRNLKAFFQWLSGQPHYKHLRASDAEYFNPPENLSRVASTHRAKSFPTLSEAKAALAAMPASTEIECRDRALLAFAICTGARDGALVSMKLKHIDVERKIVHQDARDVKTKRRKTIFTAFFPIGEEVHDIVIAWVRRLREDLGFGDDDALFPKTALSADPESGFKVTGVGRDHWASAQPVRQIFKAAFQRIDLPYANPHSFRDMLVKEAYDRKLDVEAMKAWSQNLGHESVMTTVVSYGTLPYIRQAEIIRGLDKPVTPDLTVEELVALLAKQIKRAG